MRTGTELALIAAGAAATAVAVALLTGNVYEGLLVAVFIGLGRFTLGLLGGTIAWACSLDDEEGDDADPVD